MPKSIASLISSKGKSETANMLLLDMYANETSSLNTKCKVDLLSYWCSYHRMPLIRYPCLINLKILIFEKHPF